MYAEELKAAIDEAQTVYEDEHAAVTDILALTQRLTEATQTYQYKNASLEHPLTMTSRIVNPNFEDGTTGWENDGCSRRPTRVFRANPVLLIWSVG